MVLSFRAWLCPLVKAIGFINMRLIKWIVNFLAATVIVIVSFYLVISICILFFKLTGRLSEGPMFFEIQTPSYVGLFKFQAISLAVMSACFFVRGTFGHKRDFSFLRRNHRETSK